MTDFLAGDEPTAQQINDAFPRYALKLADEALTTNTTPQSDDELLLSVAANSKYLVEMHLVFNSPAAADMKLQWSIPSGVSGWWTATGQNLGAASETVWQGLLAWGGQAQIEGNAADKAVLVRGVLVTTSSGTLTFQWSQNSSSGTTTVRANSLLVLQKIA